MLNGLFLGDGLDKFLTHRDQNDVGQRQTGRDCFNSFFGGQFKPGRGDEIDRSRQLWRVKHHFSSEFTVNGENGFKRHGWKIKGMQIVFGFLSFCSCIHTPCRCCQQTCHIRNPVLRAGACDGVVACIVVTADCVAWQGRRIIAQVRASRCRRSVGGTASTQRGQIDGAVGGGKGRQGARSTQRRRRLGSVGRGLLGCRIRSCGILVIHL